MANRKALQGMEYIGKGAFDWDDATFDGPGTPNVKCALVDMVEGDFTLDGNGRITETFNDIAANIQDASHRSDWIGTRDAVGGLLSCATVNWPNVATGNASNVIWYIDVDGTDANAILMGFWDTLPSSDPPLPYTPQNSQLQMTVPTGLIRL